MPSQSTSPRERAARGSWLARIIQSLPEGAGSALKTLSLETPFYKQVRPCEWCGTPFLPPPFQASGLVRFCGRSCSAKWRMNTPEHLAKVHTPESAAKRGKSRSAFLRSGTPEANAQVERIRDLNPMSDPEVRAKVSRRLQEMHYRPSVRGGNGTGLTKPEQILIDALGPEWGPIVVPTETRRGSGLPTHYKIDCGNEGLKIAIEADGTSHRGRKDQDARKDAFLRSCGWTVLRFSNEDILSWNASGQSMESSISMTLRQHGILPTASRDC